MKIRYSIQLFSTQTGYTVPLESQW